MEGLAVSAVVLTVVIAFMEIQEATSMEVMRDGIPKWIAQAQQDYLDGLLGNKHNGNEYIDKGAQDRVSQAGSAEKWLQSKNSAYHAIANDGSLDPDYAKAWNTMVVQNAAKIRSQNLPYVTAGVQKFAWFRWAKANPSASVPTRHAVFSLVPTLGFANKGNFNYTQCYPNEF